MTRHPKNIIFELYSSAYLAPFGAERRGPPEGWPCDKEPVIPGYRSFWGQLVVAAATGLILGILLGVIPQNVTL